MDNKHLEDTYKLGNTTSHVEGLRSVYNAGCRHDDWLADEEDAAIAKAKDGAVLAAANARDAAAVAAASPGNPTAAAASVKAKADAVAADAAVKPLVDATAAARTQRAKSAADAITANTKARVEKAAEADKARAAAVGPVPTHVPGPFPSPAKPDKFDAMTDADLRAYLDARDVVHAVDSTHADLVRMSRSAKVKESAPA